MRPPILTCKRKLTTESLPTVRRIINEKICQQNQTGWTNDLEHINWPYHLLLPVEEAAQSIPDSSSSQHQQMQNHI